MWRFKSPIILNSLSQLFFGQGSCLVMCVTMCWFNLLSNWKHLPHNSQLYSASRCEYECLSNEDCVEKYFPHFGHWTMPWSLWWCVFNPLTLENVLSHSLHLIFRLLAGGGTSVLGFIDPSVPTCNGVRLRTVCSCRTSRALPFGCVLLVDRWWEATFGTMFPFDWFRNECFRSVY